MILSHSLGEFRRGLCAFGSQYKCLSMGTNGEDVLVRRAVGGSRVVVPILRGNDENAGGRSCRSMAAGYVITLK